MFLMQLSEVEKETFIQLAYRIAIADGEFAEEEKEIFKQYAIEMNFNFDELEFENSLDDATLIQSFRSSEKDIVKKVFIELMGVALIDEDYNEQEEEILHKYIKEYDLGIEYLHSVKQCIEKINLLYKDLAGLI